MNILDNIKSLLFCFHTFGVRRTIYVLDSENQPGSGALGLTGDVWHQKYKNKKEGVQNYLTYSFNRLLKISLSLRYRAPDPVYGQNRILIPGFQKLVENTGKRNVENEKNKECMGKIRILVEYIPRVEPEN